ncbi:MAG: hypothetical protein ACK419_00655 [Pyrinomonadaceae bacterium]
MIVHGGWPKLGKKSKGNEDMGTMKSRWLERIETTIPFLEIVDEKFFGVTQFLTESSFIFGGAVVSMLLGEPIAGDLDIVVSQQKSTELIYNIMSSPKWIKRGKSENYANSNLERHINQIITFSSFDDVKLQVVVAQSRTENQIEDALTVVRGVDFSFCALAVDFQGRMFEVLRGAHEDCLKRMIRIVRDKNELSSKNLKLRLDKYIQRGFVCFENYTKLLKEIKDRELEKSSYTAGMSKITKLLYYLQNNIYFSTSDDATHLIVEGELLRKFNLMENEERFNEFSNYLSNVLSKFYSENSPECIDDEIQAEVSGPVPSEDQDSIMFFFNPYDSNTNWTKSNVYS